MPDDDVYLAALELLVDLHAVEVDNAEAEWGQSLEPIIE